MSHLEFSLILSSPTDDLMELITDFENLPKYLPDQLQNVKIIEKNNNGTITEEQIVFSSVIKNKITQQTRHLQISKNTINSEIISGPAKGSVISIKFSDSQNGTKVDVNVELKLSLKARFLSPLIQKFYKTVVSGMLYKINADAMNHASSV
tara:strand:+ start:1795 stop:2247 length:453 start_codon:yes stop_codon:yes gene_type:complete